MTDAHSNLPSGERDDASSDDFISSLGAEVQDPLQRARENLVEVDDVVVEKRRRFSRRRNQPVTDLPSHGADEGRVVDPLAVFTASLDSEDDAAISQAPEVPDLVSPVAVDDLPEPPVEEMFAEPEPEPEPAQEPEPDPEPEPSITSEQPSPMETPDSDVTVSPLLPHPAIDAPAGSISAAAVRGTFPRRSKAAAEPLPVEKAITEPTPLEKAQEAHHQAEVVAATIQAQVEDASRAVAEATERAEAAEKRATEAENSAAQAQAQAEDARKALAEATERAEAAEKRATEAESSTTQAQAEADAHAEQIAALEQRREAINATVERVARLEARLAEANSLVASEQAASSEARRERDEAQTALARQAGELAALARSEEEARSRAQALALESGAATARARSEARHRAIAEETARTQAEALRGAQMQLFQAQEALALAEQSNEAARQLAMQAADQIVASAAERVQAEKKLRLEAEARAEAAEERLRATVETAAEAASRADALEQERLSRAAQEAAAKRRTADEAAQALAAFQSTAEEPVEETADEWAFDEVQPTDWAPAAPVGEPTPEEGEHTMDPSGSSSGRRGRFHLRRQKDADDVPDTDGGRTPIENLADYVAAQGLDVPSELRPQPESAAVVESAAGAAVAPSEAVEPEAVEPQVAEPTIAASEGTEPELSEPLTDDLWSEPDADVDAVEDEAEPTEASHRRGLLRRRGATKPVVLEQPDAGLIDHEPELDGTMESTDEPSTEASVETTEQPAHEEQAVSEEPTTTEQAEEHVWTAAELAAEGWTTEDLRGAGWTDAHLESIGWKLDDAETAADEAEAAVEEPEAPAAEEAAEPEDSADAETEDTADASSEDEEPTLFGVEPTAAADEAEAADEEAADEEAEDGTEDEPVAAVEPEVVPEPEPEPVAVVEPEPEVAAEPEPVAVVEPEPVVAPEPVAEPAPATSIPAATALTLQDLTPDEIERALMLGESLSDILARKNVAVAASAAPAAAPASVSPATAVDAVAQHASGTEPSPESTTSASGGGDRGGDDADDPDPAPAPAPAPQLVEPDFVQDFEAPVEPAFHDDFPTSVIPAVVDVPSTTVDKASALSSTTATRAAGGMIASEAATETGASDAERIEYRPSNSRRYLFGGAFIAAAILSVVAIFWAIQNSGVAQSITAGCLVVLTGALWWSLMAWSPRIISIGHGVLEFAQGGHVERFNLLDPDTNIAVAADPTSRNWRAEVVRTNGTKIVIRADDVRPQQFSALVAKYREEADAAR